MARNRQCKQKHSTRKEKNAWKTDQDVEKYSTDDTAFSEKLSRVLDYVAVNDDLIRLKRTVACFLEREQTLTLKVLGYIRQYYIFGSQIEATTTIGMMSDVDSLQRFETCRLFLDSENQPLLPHGHQIVIKVSTNGYASQYCVLTIIEPSTQARRFHLLDTYRDNNDIVDFFQGWDCTKTDGMIPHAIMFIAPEQLPASLRQAKRHGPAESLGNTDTVLAYYCKSLPKQCKYVFERPRPGHWPSEQTLKKAKKYGVFIVPQAPPKSTNICTYDFFHYQWRISTNLTERLFMFSLDKIHLQAYVLTKMIRKELFSPEYRDRLSTFHFKTAFFFAVENTRPDVWRKGNLINCIKYILATLRRFLTCRHCPHFTIENVNLFDGKMERHEFPKLVDKLTNVINSLRANIENIQMDNLGKLLNKRNEFKYESSRFHMNGSALSKYILDCFHGERYIFNAFSFLEDKSVNKRIAEFENKFTLLEMYYRAPLEKYVKYDYVVHRLMSEIACLGASVYLEQKADGHEHNHINVNKARQLYLQSLESNIIANYMRYASFLFCNREYDEACTYFDLIEKQIEAEKNSNLIYKFFVSPSESLALQIANQSYGQSYKQKWSVFLIFSPEEALCVPEFLRCEMYRGRCGTFTPSNLPFYSKEDCICVQIEPYLYYLQYLTYRELHQEPKQSKALKKLSIFTEIIKSTGFYFSKDGIFLTFPHCDSSLNMLGHCLELEQKVISALNIYKTSLIMLPQRNAAVLHIIRLLWPVVQSLWT